MRSRLLLALVLVLVIPVIANAQWSSNGAAVCICPGAQSYSVPVSDGAGGAIIMWVDQRAGNNDIYAQRIDASGNVKWAVEGVAICTASGSQSGAFIVADGAGGAIITWWDYRSVVQADIYVQRINASGTVQWTANGVLLCAAAQDQYPAGLVSDGAGGAIVAWNDYRTGTADVYARRVNSAGVPQWTADGVAMCTFSGQQYSPVSTSDGTGGMIVAWEDYRGGVADIFAQRINSAGVTQWTANGVALSAATNSQSGPVISADGASGAVVAWADWRSGGNPDIYAQRVTSAGAMLWAPDGIAVCTEASAQLSPAITWDNTTGAIISWSDFRTGSAYHIYARRITPGGVSAWTSEGNPVCTASGGQGNSLLIADGSGGAIIAWQDFRGPSLDIYAQRIDATGSPKWAFDGMPLTQADFTQQWPGALMSDGSGGAIVTWYDNRSGINDIYAQRVDGRYGYWGKSEPALFAAKDVPADQGGKVRLEWYGSQRDQLNQQVISHYTIWRAIDQAAFAAAAAAGVPEVKLSDSASRFSGKAIRHDKPQAVDYFWELIGQQDATYRYAYSLTASTSFDSTASNPATHRFQIVAHSYNQFTNWPSNVLSGRSVDNLAPPAPLFLSAQRIGNYIYLKWNGVHIKDLDKYTVYRKTASGVTAIPANFLADEADTLLTDASAPTSALYYIVTATDIHQNQGLKSNEASVAAATGVGGNLPPVTALTVRQNHPNPFTGETQFDLGLPARSDVHVEWFDVAGRRVRDVKLSAQSRGWSGLKLSDRDDRGQLLPSGVYFYRVHAAGQSVTKKMVITR